MNVLKKCLLLSGCVAALTFASTTSVMAQRGNYDPAQFRQDRIDRSREQLEVKDDSEWKAIEPMVGKVIDAERDVMAMRMGGMFGRGGNRRNRTESGSTNSEPRQRRGGPFGEPSAAVTALRDAIDNKASAADIKTKLAAVRAETKEKEDKLTASQEELRGVLSSRQEAIAVVNGLLK